MPHLPDSAARSAVHRLPPPAAASVNHDTACQHEPVLLSHWKVLSMGFPDLPEKGKIWKDDEEFEYILSKLQKFCEIATPENTAKILYEAGKDLQGSVKATSLVSMSISTDMFIIV
jgi:hypothetical protein